jgi:3-dehydroquinate synthase class II
VPVGSSNNGAGADPQQILNRAQVIQLSDLKKGDAVMVVSTDGTSEVTAVTLLAGVEPLLQSSAATQSLLNNWSMGSGAPDVAPE